MMNKPYCVSVVALFVLGLPGVASAQEPQPCSELSERMAATYTETLARADGEAESGDAEGAIETLSHVLGICQDDPQIALRMARWHEAKGDCRRAIFWYDQVLDTDDPRFVAAISAAQEEARPERTALVEKCQSATLRVACEGEPGKTLIQLDDLPKTSCPSDFYVEPGSHALVATREGGANYTVTVNVEPGRNEHVVPSPTPESGSASSGTGDKDRVAESRTAPSPPPPPEYESQYLGVIIAGGVIAGLGVATLVPAAIYEFEGAALVDDFNEASDPATRERIQQDVDEVRLLSSILWGTGAVLVVGGITTLIVGLVLDEKAEASMATFWVDPQLGGGGLLWRVTW